MDCIDQETLNSFAAGDLPDWQVQSLCDHLDECASCSDRIAQIQQVPGELELALATADRWQDLRQTSAFAQLEERIRGIGLTPASSTVADPQLLATTESIALERVGPYLLGERLGRGGMGEVYKAWHDHLKRHVALKLIATSRRNDEESVRRFSWEMAAIGSLDDPHIVRALDAGVHAGRHYLVMELVEGIDVASLVRQRGPLSIADAAEIARQAACGLITIHRHGLIHRDIKPSNLMLCSSGAVKVLDLGLSRNALLDAEDKGLTGSDCIIGTADFVSPEQITDVRKADIRSDIYSLGCTLFQLLTGHAPFDGSDYPTTPAKLVAHCSEVPTPLRQLRRDVPEGLDALVGRMLAKQPADRPQSPSEVAEELARFASPAQLRRLLSPADGDEPEVPPNRFLPLASPLAAPASAPAWSWQVLLWPLATLLLASAVVTGSIWIPPLWGGSEEKRESPDPARASAPVADRPMIWVNHLEQPPQPIFWPGGGLSSWAYNPELQQITLTCNDKGLLRLGKRSNPKYRLQVGLHQNRWTGGIAVFFGLHEAVHEGEPAFRFQFIRLNSIPVNPIKYSLTRGWAALTKDERHHFKSTVVCEASIAAPRGEQLLEIEIEDSRLADVRLNGIVAADLLLPEFGKEFIPEDYRGEFGLFVTTTDAIVPQARSMVVTRER